MAAFSVSEHWRKFVLTVLGMLFTSALAALGMLVSADPTYATASASALGAMVLAFNGANAAVSWGYARNETNTSTHDAKHIQERRAAGAEDGAEPTP